MSNTKKLFSQIIKFGFVGGTAFVIDAGLLFLLTEFCGIHYLISGMISFTASVIYNYILSVKWVFDAKKKSFPKSNNESRKIPSVKTIILHQ